MLPLILDWLRQNGRELSLDLCCIAAVVYIAFSPALTLFDVTIHAAVVTAAVMRAYFAWRDWRYAPQKMNNIWYDQGREAATKTINKVARIYKLEHPEELLPFEGDLGDALFHARQDLAVRCAEAQPPVLAHTAIDVVANSVHGFWIPVDRSHTLPSPGGACRFSIRSPMPVVSASNLMTFASPEPVKYWRKIKPSAFSGPAVSTAPPR